MVSSILPSIQVKTRPSDRLYFDQYRWCVSFDLTSVSLLRGLPSDALLALKFEERCHTSVFNRSQWVTNHGGRWGDVVDKASMERHQQRLINVAQWMRDREDFGKVVVSMDRGWYYTSDWDHVLSLLDLRDVSNVRVCEAVVSRPRGTVMLADSRYKLRSYFREIKLDTMVLQQLQSWLSNQTHMRLAPSLHDWANNRVEYTSSYKALVRPAYLRSHWFVDHNEPAETLLLEMIAPRIIRRTVPIVKVNN